MPKPVKSKSKKKSSNKQNSKVGKKNITKTPIEKNFDSFRHEIYKFGLTGLDKKEQLSARVELAIKLGAKPKRWIKPNYNLSSEQQARKISRQEATNKQSLSTSNTTIANDKKRQ